MGYGTRSQIKSSIKNSEVKVNGVVVTKPEMKIDSEVDEVVYNDTVVLYNKYEYYMFYKPSDCVTATKDNRCKTVMDYMSGINREGFFPVGRLDKDTEGLLIITNDGELAHKLLSPKKHVPKLYYALVAGRMSSNMIEMFNEGLDIGDEKKTLPSKLEILSEGEESRVLITVTEGRYHQVKRMVEAVGGKVTYLKRLAMGNVVLDENLMPGEYRKLTETEVNLLKE